MGAGTDGIVAAYRLLAAHALNPRLDVCLWVEDDAWISVEPVACTPIAALGGEPSAGFRRDEVSMRAKTAGLDTTATVPGQLQHGPGRQPTPGSVSCTSGYPPAIGAAMSKPGSGALPEL
ncbi:hypothetical protein ACWDO0_30415 [Nocardia rhamnosiphila]